MPSESATHAEDGLVNRESSRAGSDTGAPDGSVEGCGSVTEPVEEAGPSGSSQPITCSGEDDEQPNNDKDDDDSLPLEDLVAKASL